MSGRRRSASKKPRRQDTDEPRIGGRRGGRLPKTVSEKDSGASGLIFLIYAEGYRKWAALLNDRLLALKLPPDNIVICPLRFDPEPDLLEARGVVFFAGLGLRELPPFFGFSRGMRSQMSVDLLSITVGAIAELRRGPWSDHLLVGHIDAQALNTDASEHAMRSLDYCALRTLLLFHDNPIEHLRSHARALTHWYPTLDRSFDLALGLWDIREYQSTDAELMLRSLHSEAPRTYPPNTEARSGPPTDAVAAHPTPRFVNTWFESSRPVPPLLVGEWYDFCLNVGPSESHLAGIPFAEPDFGRHDEVSLRVTLFSRDFKFGAREATIVVPRQGTSTVLRCPVSPLHPQRCSLDIVISLARELDTLQMLSLDIEATDAHLESTEVASQ